MDKKSKTDTKSYPLDKNKNTMDDKSLLDKILYFPLKDSRPDLVLLGLNVKEFSLSYVLKAIEDSDIPDFYKSDLVSISKLLNKYKDYTLLLRYDEIIYDFRGLKLIQIYQSNNTGRVMIINVETYKRYIKGGHL